MPEAEGVTTAETEVPHDSGGMPQLNPDYFAPQIFWLVVSFVLLYLLMSRVALPRIAGVIEERRDKIADDLDKAQSLKKDADMALAAYERALAEGRSRAQAITAEARARLKAEGDRLRAELDAKLVARAREAEAHVRVAKEAALANLKPVASEVAAVIVSKLLGESAGAEAAERAVLAELHSKGSAEKLSDERELMAAATELAQRVAVRLPGKLARADEIESAVQAVMRVAPRQTEAAVPALSDASPQAGPMFSAPTVELAIKALRRVLGEAANHAEIAEAVNAEIRRG